MSTTHLLRTIADTSTEYDTLVAARDQYLLLALQQQRAALSTLHASNVDALSFSALLISLNAFSMLGERSLDPYEPPMDWLEMGRGAGSVMRQGVELMGQASDTKLQEIVNTTAPIHMNFEAVELDRDALRPYEPLLRPLTDVSADEDDDRCFDVYRKTLAYIVSFRQAIQSGEPAYVDIRRICIFPFTIPSEFIDLVRQRRPRALIVLAHFFAVISNTDALRYLGGADISVSRREVLAIHQSLPHQWHALMIWPVDEVRAER